jgi:hypothetical protein
MNATGWSTLYIETNDLYDDFTQMYGAGYLEGDLISEFS